MACWIDTHCHLDATELWPQTQEERAQAAIEIDGTGSTSAQHGYWPHPTESIRCVIPAVQVANFEAVRQLAHQGGHAYALGIHPLYVPAAQADDLNRLDAALARYHDDPRLVAVGEIGLDFLVPALCTSLGRERQQHFYRAQLALARKYDLPVILHVRRAVDQVLKGLRDGSRATPAYHAAGIAHAFNGSEQQARAFLALGFKLGFGGAVTFERALHLRHLAASLPLSALVLETDAPDIPPRWLYQTLRQRQAGQAQGINSPAELPRIGMELAKLRALAANALAATTTHNAMQALPRLAGLCHLSA